MGGRRELTRRQQKIIGASALALALLLCALLCWRVGVPMLRFASEPERFRLWVEERGLLGRLAYMGMVALQVVVAIIPGEPLEIAGGYAFGALEGTLLCLAAGTLGSVAVFALVRRFGPRLAEVFFPEKKIRSLRFLKNGRRRDILFFLIFMTPGTPKDLLCYFAGLTGMKFGTWVLICSLGRIPSVVTSTIGGNALGTESYRFAVVMFLIALAVSAAGMLGYRQLQRRNERLGTGAGSRKLGSRG